MKPVITFLLGALLASAFAVFFLKRNDPPATESASTAVATPAPADSAASPEAGQESSASAQREPVATVPSRVASQRDTRASSRQQKNSASPTFSSGTTSRAPSVGDSSTAKGQPTTPPTGNTTTTSVGPQGGPPQTTLHLPPAPEGARVAEVPSPPARVPKTVTIPAGTLLSVRVDERLSSSTSQTGDSFRATLDQPLVIDGAVIAERGARVEGRVSESDPGGRVRGTATLALELVRLNTSDGQRIRLQTAGFTKSAERSVKKDAAKVGIGAGIGAAIGAIAGGGKGAAIGAGVGGAAGTGAVMTSRGDAAEVAPETRMTFRLEEAITVTEKLK